MKMKRLRRLEPSGIASLRRRLPTPLRSRSRARGLALQRGSRSMLGAAVLVGAGAGATLMYVFDPERGRRRRALARDRAAHAVHQERVFLGKAARDLQHRSVGMFAKLRHIANDHPPDALLLERVRSVLGRHVTHPGSIEVGVDDGTITLRGPVLADEIEGLLQGVGRVRGVHEVINRLEAHASAENVPGLQGAGFLPRPRRRRDLWPPAYRAAAIGSGLAAGAGGIARGGIGGSMLATAGGLLALRGLANMPLRRFFGLERRRRGIDVQKTLTVHRPIDEVFEFWVHPENFPHFMEHVRHVSVDPDRKLAHWKVEGPGGTAFAFDAEVTNLEHNRVFAWKTTEGSTIGHAGVVRFEEEGPDATRIHVRMTYQPPGGAIGHAVASLFRKDPKHALDDDLLRMKSLLETGKATAHGETTSLDDLH